MVNTTIQKREFPDGTIGYDVNWIFRQDKDRHKFYCCDGLKDIVCNDGAAFIVNEHGLVMRRQNKPSRDRLLVCPICETKIIHEDKKVVDNTTVKKFKLDPNLGNNVLMS